MGRKFHAGSRVGRQASPLCVLIAAIAVTGCGGGGVRVLSSAEAKHLLLQLPYRYHWRKVELPEGASGALAGTAIGRHHTVFHFGLALGREPHGVPVPLAGADEAYGYGGYIFTDDILVPGKREKWESGPQYKPEAQWREAGRMEVNMEEKLCRAETGEPCHEW
jgi:hypothetical protein